MSLPVLGKAREQAKTTACAAQLRQLGLGMMIYESFDNVWGASLFRVGILMMCLWLFLAARKGPTAKPSPVATWVTMGLAGFALAAIRSRKPILVMVVGVVFALVAFVVKPRQKRG